VIVGSFGSILRPVADCFAVVASFVYVYAMFAVSLFRCKYSLAERCTAPRRTPGRAASRLRAVGRRR
jgi:hypothetical protein